MRKIIPSKLVKQLPILVLMVTMTSPGISQNTGIGTVNPIEKLHVAGNIKVDTIKPMAIKLTPNSGDGKILTSDAAGNASWQSKTLSAGNIGYGVWGDCGTNGNISEYQPVADTAGFFGWFFGTSVSVSGNYAIIGAHFSPVGVNSEQGAANIYHYNGTSWVFMQTLTDPTGATGDHFGISVSISGNYAIVGAYHDDGVSSIDRGSASIYQYNGSSWVFMQKITDGGGAANDNFGCSVAISGNAVIIGANMDDIGGNVDQGSVTFYRYNGTSWVLTQKSADPSGAAGDRYGGSVAISGDNAIIGVMRDDILSNADQGSAIIYHYNGVTGWDLYQTLTDPVGAGIDNFGNAVSISGNYLIVGAFNDQRDTISGQGSVSLYQYFPGDGWALMQKIADAAGAANDRFGYSVAISGNYAIVGTVMDDMTGAADQGSAVIYQRVGTGWQKLQFITDPGGTSGDLFGAAAAIDATTKQFIIGAIGYNSGTGKVVFGKIN